MDSIIDVMSMKITGDGRKLWGGTRGARLVATSQWADMKKRGEDLWGAPALKTENEEKKIEALNLTTQNTMT